MSVGIGGGLPSVYRGAGSFPKQTVPCYDCLTRRPMDLPKSAQGVILNDHFQNNRRPPSPCHRIGSHSLCGARTTAHLHAGADGNGLPHLDASPHRYAPSDLDAPPHLDARTYNHTVPYAYPVPHLDTGAYGHAIPHLDAGPHRNALPHAYPVPNLDAGAHPNTNSRAGQPMDPAHGFVPLG